MVNMDKFKNKLQHFRRKPLPDYLMEPKLNLPDGFRSWGLAL